MSRQCYCGHPEHEHTREDNLCALIDITTRKFCCDCEGFQVPIERLKDLVMKLDNYSTEGDPLEVLGTLVDTVADTVEANARATLELAEEIEKLKE